MMKKALVSISFLLIFGILSGCGVKPSAVDAPISAEQDRFPRTYPDPSTDQK